MSMQESNKDWIDKELEDVHLKNITKDEYEEYMIDKYGEEYDILEEPDENFNSPQSVIDASNEVKDRELEQLLQSSNKEPSSKEMRQNNLRNKLLQLQAYLNLDETDPRLDRLGEIYEKHPDLDSNFGLIYISTDIDDIKDLEKRYGIELDGRDVQYNIKFNEYKDKTHPNISKEDFIKRLQDHTQDEHTAKQLIKGYKRYKIAPFNDEHNEKKLNIPSISSIGKTKKPIVTNIENIEKQPNKIKRVFTKFRKPRSR